MQLTSPRIT